MKNITKRGTKRTEGIDRQFTIRRPFRKFKDAVSNVKHTSFRMVNVLAILLALHGITFAGNLKQNNKIEPNMIPNMIEYNKMKGERDYTQYHRYLNQMIKALNWNDKKSIRDMMKNSIIKLIHIKIEEFK